MRKILDEENKARVVTQRLEADVVTYRRYHNVTRQTPQPVAVCFLQQHKAAGASTPLATRAARQSVPPWLKSASMIIAPRLFLTAPLQATAMADAAPNSGALSPAIRQSSTRLPRCSKRVTRDVLTEKAIAKSGQGQL